MRFSGDKLKLHFIRRNLSIRTAFVLSVLAHAFAFMLASWLVGAILPTRDSFIPPKFLTFSFLPESIGTSDQRPMSSRQQSVKPEERTANSAAGSSMPMVEPTKDPTLFQADQTEEAQVQETVLKASDIGNDEVPARPHQIPDNSEAFRTHASFFHGTGGMSIAFEKPRTRTRRTELAPLTVPIARKELKQILKQVKKLTREVLPSTVFDSSFVFEAGKDQQFEVQVKHSPAESATDLDQVVVTVTTDEEGEAWRTQMRLKRLAFSHFAQFVDYWDPQVAVHDDKLDGRFHTNTGFSVSTSKGVRPEFNGKVTTAAFDIRTADRFPLYDEDEVFKAGLETGVREIRLPEKFNPLPNSAADSLVRVLTEEAWINFNPDGSYDWRVASSQRFRKRLRPRSDTYSIVGRKSTLHVRGVVKGKVLVYSDRKVIIEGSLTYSCHPETPGADDYLGLVCKKNIEIADPEVTGPGDLHVHAAILAGGRFNVRDLYGAGHATLHIYGSLTAGSLSATEPRYATDVRFDKRLEDRRPAHFPMTDRYEVSEWNEKWEKVD